MNNNQATISNEPAANAPDAAAYKGKGKAAEDPSVAQEMSMDEDESEESENENEELVSLQWINWFQHTDRKTLVLTFVFT